MRNIYLRAFSTSCHHTYNYHLSFGQQGYNVIFFFPSRQLSSGTQIEKLKLPKNLNKISPRHTHTIAFFYTDCSQVLKDICKYISEAGVDGHTPESFTGIRRQFGAPWPSNVTDVKQLHTEMAVELIITENARQEKFMLFKY